MQQLTETLTLSNDLRFSHGSVESLFWPRFQFKLFQHTDKRTELA